MLIHCKTQEEWDKTIRKLLDDGYYWLSRNNVLHSDFYSKDICFVKAERGEHFRYGNSGSFRGEQFIEASDFLREEKTEDDGEIRIEDLKVGDRVVAKGKAGIVIDVSQNQAHIIRGQDPYHWSIKPSAQDGRYWGEDNEDGYLKWEKGPIKEEKRRKFNVGDKVRIKNLCSGCEAGEICTVRRGRIEGSALNCLYARNGRIEETGSSGCSCQNNWELVEEGAVNEPKPEPKFQVGQVLFFRSPVSRDYDEKFEVVNISSEGNNYVYWKDGLNGFNERYCELYCGEPLNAWDEEDEIKPINLVDCQEYFNKVNEMFLGGIITNNKPKKNIMNTIVDFAKNITLPADEKLLRKVGIKNDQGNYTEAAREIVVNFEAVELGYKNEQDLFTKVGYSNNLSSFEYASLLKKYEAKLIEVAKQMEEENKKK